MQFISQTSALIIKTNNAVFNKLMKNTNFLIYQHEIHDANLAIFILK